jgi:hypothetical protein
MILRYVTHFYMGKPETTHFTAVDKNGRAFTACGAIFSPPDSACANGQVEMHLKMPNTAICKSCASRATGKWAKDRFGDKPKNWSSPPKIARETKTDDHEYFDDIDWSNDVFYLESPVERVAKNKKPKAVQPLDPVRSQNRTT